MKRKYLIKRCLIIAVLLPIQILKGQNISGKATYMSKKDMQMTLDTTKHDYETRKKVASFFTKAFEKEYELNFNQEKSIYREKDHLASQAPGKNSTSSSVRDALYKDFKEGNYVHRKELLGKLFSIHDTIVQYDWQVTGESKNIGVYTCYKATLLKEEEGATKTIIAWFAPEIPVASGPSIYGGLPGLILELNDSEYTILCTSVAIKTDELLNIKKPKDGKVVSANEFYEIQENKLIDDKEKLIDFMKDRESSIRN